jgi:PAS domain S-box-containing protein
MKPLMELRGLRVRYGNLVALDGVDFALPPGEIHAVVGEPGSGKSSLARVIAGALRPERGSLAWDGKPLSGFDRDAARDLGIEYVPQETSIFKHQTVAFNLFVNRKRLFPGFIFRPARIIAEAERYLARVGAAIDARADILGLPLPDRMLVEILRGMAAEPRLLILDEALEKLSADGLARVRTLMRQVAAGGGTVLVLTHRIDDIHGFADRVTILRAGTILMTDRAGKVDQLSLIKLAYAQIMNRPASVSMNEDFYHFLKYNEAILEHLPVSLVVVDRDGLIQLRNRKAQECFGAAPAGQRLQELFGPGNHEVLAAASASAGGRAFDCAYGLKLTVAGEVRTIDLTFDPILDGGRYLGGMLIFNDTTEQERLRERMVVAEKLAAVGLLSAGVAHEINNPLETICNSVDYLKFMVAEAEPVKALARIEAEVASIGHIVSNLMAFTGGAAERPDRLDLGGLVAELVALLRHNPAFTGREIAFEGPGGPLQVVAARTEVRQVFLNLIKNGLEAMPGGGVLQVRLRREEAGGVAWAVGEVQDQGPGLDPATRKNLFLPFFSTKSGVAGHMGLGLSIAYGILAKLGGSIEAASLEQGGSRFTVRFPACG